VSPIFVRPVREQLEHDRLIRFLQNKYKRKYDAQINVGDERVAPVKIGAGTFYPDLVLMDGKKIEGLVEVESGESVNNLEAMAQWVHFARSRVPFHLYVPVTAYDAARRLCEAHQTRISEVWTYRAAADGFDLVRMSHDAAAVAASPRGAAKAVIPPKPPAPPPPPPAPPVKSVSPAKPALPAKPTAATKPATPTKPAAAGKPATPTKPAAVTKPAAATKPAAPTAPAKGTSAVKPAAPVKAATPPKGKKPAAKAVKPAAKPTGKSAAKDKKSAAKARKPGPRHKR
jgi:hypothetical protein